MNSLCRIILLVVTVALLTACGGYTPLVKKIEIEQKVEPIEVLHPPLPDGVTWEQFEIKVLTPDVMRELLAAVDRGEIDEDDAVFAALTPDGYEHLAIDLAELKRFIQDQKSVIMYYRNTIPKEIFLPEVETKEPVEEPTE